MIRSSTGLRVVVCLCVFSNAALHSLDPCLAQQENEEPKVLPLSAASVARPGWSIGKAFYNTSVEWEGQEYAAAEAIDVLMQVIMDPETASSMRADALGKLGTLASWFPNTNSVPELISLFDKLREREEKAAIIRCLILSQDPRGLPLFVKVLNQEEDNTLRFAAAYCLANWNVRRGVAELVKLLDSKEILPKPVRIRHLRDNARDVFLDENRHKGWGFPEEEIRKSIEGRAGLNREQSVALYVSEIKKWFVENKDRFPVWKPGDPLPAAPKLPPIPPGPESMLPLSAAFRPPEMAWTVAQEKEEEISWQGKRYPTAKAVDVFMKVALEPGGMGDRFRAIERLGRLGGHLRNTKRIPQLMKLYGRLTGGSEKVALLFCLARSKDQRALPLFAEILDTRQEEYLRLPAAYGLALWNVRRGVRELIELLSVRQTESPIRYPGIIGDEAVRLLSRLNYWKSWWAPEAALQAAAEARTEVHDELLHSCRAELKKWFAENEHRFPDWKPGDPLPVIPEPKTDNPDEPSRSGKPYP